MHQKFNFSECFPQFDAFEISYGFSGKNDSVPNINRPKQVHGTDIVEACDHKTGPLTTSRVNADGIYVARPGVPIGVVTADCVPILFANKQKTFVMAVHAGWRGICSGIVARACQFALGRFVDKADNLLVGIGPAISAKQYEVGTDVYGALEKSIGKDLLQRVCFANTNDKYQLDLVNLTKIILRSFDICSKNIQIMNSCTYSNPDIWHSYRRDGSNCGRNYNWICIP